MQTLDITLAAAEIKAFDIGGNYFELIEGSGAVDVAFVNAQGSRARDLEMLGALPGYWVSGQYSRFELKNQLGLTQTVRVMFGSGVGGSRRIQGNVSVVDAVDPTCQLFIGSVLTVGTNITPLITPAQNTKGIVIRQSAVELTAGAGGSINGRLIAAPTAPGNIFPTGVPAIILNSVYNSTTSLVSNYLFDTRRKLPPAWGLYYCNQVNVAAATAASMWCSAEILQ